MFAVRINFASFRARHVAVSSLTSVNNQRSFSKKLPIAESKKLIVSKKVVSDDTLVSFRLAHFNLSVARHSASLLRFSSRCRAYSTNAKSKANVFGELGNRHFENVEMDKDEKAEEKFVENEARVDRKYRLSPGGYANLIKGHIKNRDYDAALQVLELVKDNRDKPTTYMYNLLLRAFAVSGNLKKCRSLYTKMKKRELPCNAATYTSIINACANSKHSEIALDYLSDLREELMLKNVVLNETHYNTMIKAYGRHKRLLEAFKIADEMRDKKLPTGEVTFNSLLTCAISDTESGLRYALAIWHLMLARKIKPTITTYNLLLRAIRDTRFGDLKVHDFVLIASPKHEIIVSEEAETNLLDFPPGVSSLLLKQNKGWQSEEVDENNTETVARQSENLPATVDADSDEKSLTVDQKRLSKFPLEKIHRKNRLILFGGLTGILERMAKDNVNPDTKTITLLMEIVPKSDAAEKNIIKIARSKGVALDIDFFNMLMKKRTLRKDYAGAKQVLDDIQRCGLCPDVITWGILAMSCETSEDARALIEGMEMTGHRLNAVIAGTLINIACRKIRFGYILEIMETMSRQNVKPNWELYVTLDAFQVEMTEMIKSKKFSRTVNHPAFKTGFSKFNLRYSTWQEKMGRKIEKDKQKKNY